MKPIPKMAGLLAVVLAAGWYLRGGREEVRVDLTVPASGLVPAQDAARKAFAEQARGRTLLVSGRVERILADDRDGSPHQRFIIVTNSGQTLLVAHNLDLAPRLLAHTPDTAVVAGEMQAEVLRGGQRRELATRYLAVWLRDGGDWQLVACQGTALPTS